MLKMTGTPLQGSLICGLERWSLISVIWVTKLKSFTRSPKQLSTETKKGSGWIVLSKNTTDMWQYDMMCVHTGAITETEHTPSSQREA